MTWLDRITVPPETDVAGEDVADVRGGDRVDRLERLVQHQQPRGVHERARQGHLLRHTGGVVDHEHAAGVGEAEGLEQLGGARGDDRPRSMPRSRPA